MNKIYVPINNKKNYCEYEEFNVKEGLIKSESKIRVKLRYEREYVPLEKRRKDFSDL